MGKLTVALMVTPPAAAYLLTDKLSYMIVLSAIIGVMSVISGFWLAIILLDANIAGSMATMAGLVFLVVFLFAPYRGIIAIAKRRSRQKWKFAGKMLAIRLLNHEETQDEERESQCVHQEENLCWTQDFASRVINYTVN